MFSKRLAAFAIFIFAVSCSKPAMDIKPVFLEVGSTSCLTGTFQRFQSFFEGAPDAANIHIVWSCARQIVTDFETITTGAQPDRYSAEELRGFLQRYFFKDGVSDGVLSETMRLKQFLVGGDTQYVTRAEITQILSDLDQLDAMTADLAPVTPILFGKTNDSVSALQWTKAYQSLALNLDQLGAIFSSTKQTYAFADLQSLLAAWADELDLPDDNIVRRTARLMPSIGVAKGVLIAGSNKTMTSPEWRPLFAKISAAYTQYRMAARLYDSDPNDRLVFLGRAELEPLVMNVVDLLDQAVTAHSTGGIPLDDIQTMLTGLQDAGYFPGKFSVAQVMTALQFVLSRLMDGNSTPTTNFNSGHIVQLRKFLARWQVLETALETGNFTAVPEFDQALRPDSVANPGWVLKLDDGGRMQIPSTGPNRLNREFSLLFTSVEWLGTKWARWPLSADDFHTIVKDLLGFLHDLNLLPNTDDTISTKLLMEANLFMPGSNGDGILDLWEAFQYGAYALSSYHGSSQFMQLAGAGCHATDYACYKAIMFQNRAGLFSNFPLLGAWLTASNWPVFSQNVAGIVGDDQILQQFMVIHYAETFMQRWDRDHDGFIDINEAESSYPLFHPSLDTLLVNRGLLPEDQLLAFFTYLFKYGEAPDPTKLFPGLLAWEYWRFFPQKWQVEADRNTLTSILAQLAKLENLPGQ